MKRLKNRLILLFWSGLAFFPVPKEDIRKNRRANGEILRSGAFWQPGEYIENQALWKGVRFGTRYDMAYGGCGIMAVYNALKALGEQQTADSLEELMDRFQGKGAAVGGMLGLAPEAIRAFFIRRGLCVDSVVSGDAAQIDRLGDGGSVFVATVCNGRRLRDKFHSVCITGDGKTGFLVHNGYHQKETEGGKIYCANGPFPCLSEAVRQTSAKGAVPVIVMRVGQARREA